MHDRWASCSWWWRMRRVPCTFGRCPAAVRASCRRRRRRRGGGCCGSCWRRCCDFGDGGIFGMMDRRRRCVRVRRSGRWRRRWRDVADRHHPPWEGLSHRAIGPLYYSIMQCLTVFLFPVWVVAQCDASLSLELSISTTYLLFSTYLHFGGRAEDREDGEEDGGKWQSCFCQHQHSKIVRYGVFENTVLLATSYCRNSTKGKI